jgi:hypothetical protein
MTTSTTSGITNTLQTAATAFRSSGKRPPAAEVVKALLEAEKTAKQQKITYPLTSLLGRWRLCFIVTGKPKEVAGIVKGRGWYVPITKAYISFSQNGDVLEIGNELKVGAIAFKVTGPFQYLGQKNILAFDFTQMQLSLFGRQVYSGNFGSGQAQDFAKRSIAKLAFFAFFIVTDDLIAARGRGGGLALWIRDN